MSGKEQIIAPNSLTIGSMSSDVIAAVSKAVPESESSDFIVLWGPYFRTLVELTFKYYHGIYGSDVPFHTEEIREDIESKLNPIIAQLSAAWKLPESEAGAEISAATQSLVSALEKIQGHIANQSATKKKRQSKPAKGEDAAKAADESSPAAEMSEWQKELADYGQSVDTARERFIADLGKIDVSETARILEIEKLKHLMRHRHLPQAEREEAAARLRQLGVDEETESTSYTSAPEDISELQAEESKPGASLEDLKTMMEKKFSKPESDKPNTKTSAVSKYHPQYDRTEGIWDLDKEAGIIRRRKAMIENAVAGNPVVPFKVGDTVGFNHNSALNSGTIESFTETEYTLRTAAGNVTVPHEAVFELGAEGLF